MVVEGLALDKPILAGVHPRALFDGVEMQIYPMLVNTMPQSELLEEVASAIFDLDLTEFLVDTLAFTLPTIVANRDEEALITLASSIGMKQEDLLIQNMQVSTHTPSHFMHVAD